MTYWLSGTIVPFDDEQRRRVPLSSSISNNPGMNTSLFDDFRQGSEIRSSTDLYRSTQPKLWGGISTVSGTVTHEQQVVTYGQARGYAEFFGDTSFKEKQKFNPVSYVELGNDYPFPVVFNEGPQQQEEASIEPLTIPDRLLPSNEGRDKAHSVKASLEHGNQLDGRLNGNSLIKQQIPYDGPLNPRPFLDFGETSLGTTTDGSINYPNATTTVQRTLPAFKDRRREVVVDLIAAGTEMTGSLMALALDEEDIREFGHRSSAAGWTVYGPNQSRYGTDSIAFIGTYRGS